MTQEQLIQQIMMSAFADELEKIGSSRDFDDLSEMEKVAIYKKYVRPALVAAGLMAAPAAKEVSDVGAKRLSSFVQQASQSAPAPRRGAPVRMRRKATPAMTPQSGGGAGDMTPGYMSYDEAMKATGGDSRKAIAMTAGTSGGKVWRD